MPWDNPSRHCRRSGKRARLFLPYLIANAAFARDNVRINIDIELRPSDFNLANFEAGSINVEALLQSWHGPEWERKDHKTPRSIDGSDSPGSDVTRVHGH